MTSKHEQQSSPTSKAFEKPEQGPEPDPDTYQPLPGTENVGESIGRRGEDVSKKEHEAGRYSTGKDDTEAGRPTGESTRRDVSGLNPDKK
ncbi:MAG: hypothetical protein QOH53_2345 [Ilumatobacteraceae bacterium]|jgi:hypothetical protein